MVKEREIKENYNWHTATSTEVSLLDAVVNATAKVSALPWYYNWQALQSKLLIQQYDETFSEAGAALLPSRQHMAMFNTSRIA